MINKDRIVPIEKIDFLSMIGTVMNLIGASNFHVDATDAEGNLTVTGSGDVGTVLANQPLVSANFPAGVTAGVLYFVPDYKFSGFKIAGVAVEAEGDTPDYKGVALYSATLSSGTVTVAAVTPIAE
ncbi:MAG: hypothetical protein IIZ07_08625 [Ruminococcus sp.]|nr:hypothetical protein [Ruminococcus sp.]